MDEGTPFLIAADLILAVHLGFVLFVVLGLILILSGGVLGWRWVRNPQFRIIHLLAIVFVVIQTWLGAACPLTVWEMALRDRAGDAVYQGAFVAHWLGRLLYYQAPNWVFGVVYTLFALLVGASWYWVRPRRLRTYPAD